MAGIIKQAGDFIWQVEDYEYLLRAQTDPDIGEVILVASFDKSSKSWQGFVFKEATKFSTDRFGSIRKFFEYIVKMINDVLDQRHGAASIDPIKKLSQLEELQEFINTGIGVDKNGRLFVK